MDKLYEFNDSYIGKDDFKTALKNLGINDKDVLFVHSDIVAFGKLACKSRNVLFTSILDSIKETIGEDGIMIMPAFSYSFCKNEVFDVDKTKGTVGALNEFFRKQEDTERTVQPIFSCAVWGKSKEKFLNVSKDSFGEASIFDKLYKNNGKLIFLGADFHSCTYLHYIEQNFKIPYRYIKTFRGSIKNGDKEYESTCDFFVRYLDKDVVLETERLRKHLIENKIMKCEKVGNGNILCVGARDLYDEVFKLLKKDIFYLLVNPVQI